jgi:hypothetical protein
VHPGNPSLGETRTTLGNNATSLLLEDYLRIHHDVSGVRRPDWSSYVDSISKKQQTWVIVAKDNEKGLDCR